MDGSISTRFASGYTSLEERVSQFVWHMSINRGSWNRYENNWEAFYSGGAGTSFWSPQLYTHRAIERGPLWIEGGATSESAASSMQAERCSAAARGVCK